ncbi:MAG: hypothetical protein LBE27_07090 [Deltaproteobacteria bacterium]|jgi:4-diphosphocytidyl-2-C-methyl-D-erythritol kinase|nr:hypothetical protein [Deltaproteobacteria bacterium]
MIILSPAKINLYLHVHGLLPDGYHELSSLMARLSLADVLLLELSKDDLAAKDRRGTERRNTDRRREDRRAVDRRAREDDRRDQDRRHDDRRLWDRRQADRRETDRRGHDRRTGGDRRQSVRYSVTDAQDRIKTAEIMVSGPDGIMRDRRLADRRQGDRRQDDRRESQRRAQVERRMESRRHDDRRKPEDRRALERRHKNERREGPRRSGHDRRELSPEQLRRPGEMEDVLKVEFEPKTLTVPDFPIHDNICLKAVRLFREKTGFPKKPVTIHLTKKIPVSAGLGGGSSNCAAVLKCLNSHLQEPLPEEELLKIGSELGSDVPFFILDHPLLVASGKGESLKLYKGAAIPPYVLLISPMPGVKTSEVFQKYELTKKASGTNLKPASKPSTKLGHNSLYHAAGSLQPQIEAAKKALEKTLPYASGLSGSGPTLWALFDTLAAAQKAESKVKDSVPWYGVFTII